MDSLPVILNISSSAVGKMAWQLFEEETDNKAWGYNYPCFLQLAIIILDLKEKGLKIPILDSAV